ncbi:MAG TPA: ATP-binding protein [Spongiibacteraceae bacterium]
MNTGLSASRLLKISLQSEHDVVAARQRARQISTLLGFGNQDQVRIGTAVSEIARNAFRYARNGSVEFFIGAEPLHLRIRIADSGGGIANLQDVLDGHYRSATGLGMGLIGTMRLMDSCDIETGERGTVVTLTKILPPEMRTLSASSTQIIAQLGANPPADAYNEIQLQNQELLQTLADLRARQDELLNLTRELEDTNRGVVALYSEIDEQAAHLRRADEMKSRFLSNMSHEFRTPLGSIRALSQLLLDRIDGNLSEEQEKQVQLIRKSADELSELVNDLLDMAKIEAGKVQVTPSVFVVADLFSGLRGMLRPLLQVENLELSFEVEPGLESLYADESKISHILRNFISNALKYTERGKIIVRAAGENDGASVRFSVEDSGIGIASEDLQLIFEEFSQIENPLQKCAKGTGLGLPLCRKLASLLSGYVEVQSAPGIGSTFSVVIPFTPASVNSDAFLEKSENFAPEENAAKDFPILFVEDHQPTQLLYKKYLQNTAYRPLCVEDLQEAHALWQHKRPGAIVLDIMRSGKDGWQWLKKIKSDTESRDIPVIVVGELAEKQKGFLLGADRYCVTPLRRDDLLGALRQLVSASQPTHTANSAQAATSTQQATAPARPSTTELIQHTESAQQMERQQITPPFFVSSAAPQESAERP